MLATALKWAFFDPAANYDLLAVWVGGNCFHILSDLGCAVHCLSDLDSVHHLAGLGNIHYFCWILVHQNLPGFLDFHNQIPPGSTGFAARSKFK